MGPKASICLEVGGKNPVEITSVLCGVSLREHVLNVMLNCRNLNLNLIQLIAHTHSVDNHDDHNDDDDDDDEGLDAFWQSE